MTNRVKWIVLAAISVIAIGATVLVGLFAWQQYAQRQNAPTAVETANPGQQVSGDRIVFRNTAAGAGYGLVASVPLAEPDGPRTISDIACDRVDAVDEEFVCLRSERGIVPTYTATVYSDDGAVVSEWPLTGIPSRTRFSDDGTLVATTAFVTGHSYATIGFSTETTVRTADTGESFGNLEEFTLLKDGAEIAPVDRNYWGVTFIDDDTFYATAGLTTVGTTYLVRGDLAARTLTVVADDVECPSLSPDGTRIAFKRVTAGAGATVHWTPAVLDLATGEVRVLDIERRSIDDQIAWLDDETLLYGMPREDAVGDTDVWALGADGQSEAEIFIEHAWSPSVVAAG